MSNKALVTILLLLFGTVGSSLAQAPVKIGEKVTVKEATTHPYSTSAPGVVFEKEFHSENSSYIKIHFKNFDLAPGDFLQVSSPDSKRFINYVGKGRRSGDPASTAKSDFWSQSIFDDHVVIRLYSNGPSQNYGFDIDAVAYGYPEEKLRTLHEPFAVCGKDDKEEIACYKGTEMYNKSRAVCRVVIESIYSCTGWLIGSEGHVMTNNHCIKNASQASTAEFHFNYEFKNCDGTGEQNDVVATSSTLVKTNNNFDYTLVKLPVNPTSKYGYLSIRSKKVEVGERIYIVQHPLGYEKEIAVKDDESPTGFGRITGNNKRVTYQTDTNKGSSGSPVLSYEDNMVVVLHNSGGCSDAVGGNGGNRNDNIIADLGTLMPKDGVDSGGGGNGPCNGTPNPSAEVSKTDETGEGSNDGTVTFTFPDVDGRSQIEFSLDGGKTYPHTSADNRGSLTVENLSPATYDLYARWGGGDCPQSLGSVTIKPGKGDGGPCDGTPNPSADVSKTDASDDSSNDGTITFTFPDVNGRRKIEFSLDGGRTYPHTAADDKGSLKVENLSPGTYELYTRWGNGGDCPVSLGSVTINAGTGGGDCNGTPNPTADISKTDETEQDANDGTITFTFPDVDGRREIEFSLDGGRTYPHSSANNVGFFTVESLSPATYDLYVRWGGGDCPQSLGTVTIKPADSNGGDCNGTPNPSADVSKTDASDDNSNDGTITFKFSDVEGRSELEFSLDGGSTYPHTSPDDAGSFTIEGLSPGTYDLYVRWGRGDCPQSLGAVTIEAGGSGDCPDCINFNNYRLNPHGNGDDQGTGTVSGGGYTLTLEKNAWKSIDFDYDVTFNTIIEFEFSSTSEGEIHAIGLDTDASLNPNKTFKLYGTESWGLPYYDRYVGYGAVQGFVVRIGRFISSGSYDRMVFVADDDASGSGNSVFSKVKIYEDNTFDAHDQRFSDNSDTGTLEVYPNPVQDALYLRGVDSSQPYRVMNTMGVEVMKGIGNKLDVSELKEGIYLIRTQSKGVIRFMKK